jgi:predicted helicase
MLAGDHRGGLAAERQKQAPIFVVIGNPPYNQKQAEEAGHNQNRRYKTVDHWIAESYGKKSRAKNKQASAIHT